MRKASKRALQGQIPPRLFVMIACAPELEEGMSEAEYIEGLRKVVGRYLEEYPEEDEYEPFFVEAYDKRKYQILLEERRKMLRRRDG